MLLATAAPTLYIRPVLPREKVSGALRIYKLYLNMDPAKIADPIDDDPKVEHLDTIPSHINITHDDVFGELTEDGPNYRNVHTGQPINSNERKLTITAGRVHRNRHSHDENSDWSRCPSHSICV